jgi:hypothetical protein
VTSGSRRTAKGRLALALACLLFCRVGTAEALPGEQAPETDAHTRTAARTLAAQAAEAFENQQYLVALDLFQRAGALIPAPTIVLMEARSLVELRRWVEAADKYSTVKHMRSSEDANSAFQMAVQAADDELNTLRQRIPLLNVSVQQAHGDQATEIWIDGRLLPQPLVGVDNPLDPGNHRVEVHQSGREPIVREVLLREADRQQLVIELEPEIPPPVLVAPQAHSVTTEVPPAPVESTSTLGWVALGTGAAATLVGAATGMYALNKKSELDDVCTPGCPAGYEDDIDDFRRYRTISYLAFGLGAAGLAWGGYVLIAGTPEAPVAAVRFAPGGASVEGTF